MSITGTSPNIRVGTGGGGEGLWYTCGFPFYTDWGVTGDHWLVWYGDGSISVSGPATATELSAYIWIVDRTGDGMVEIEHDGCSYGTMLIHQLPAALLGYCD